MLHAGSVSAAVSKLFLLDDGQRFDNPGKVRVAKNNRSKLFDTVSLIESNSLAGYFRLIVSGTICARAFKI